MAWDLELVCGLAARGLEERARALDEEGSVRGIDCLDEVALHPVLREALASEQVDGARFGVHAEQRYPGDRGRARRSEGERCDVVLTREADPARGRLLDPLEAGTLFAEVGVAPEDALWIEVKVAGQFAMIDGVGQANPRYSSVLLREVPADARKLARDAVIRDGAVLTVVFNANEATAAHDLDAWRVRCLEKGVPLESPFVRRFSIADRIGNGVCGVVVAPVRG